MLNISSVLLCTALYSIAAQNVFAATTKPNQLESGECLNNSLDSDCNYQESGDKSGPDGQDNSVDDARKLRIRLETIDQLHDGDRSGSSQSNGSEPSLRQVFFLHRHGDRTPIEFPPKDKLASEPFWTFHGLGQLTNRGKARLYLLGKMMRKRYSQFLGGSVSKNQRITRSSGSLRCIESAQTFLAGFLSLDSPNSPDASELVWDHSPANRLAHLWQPANVQAVPQKFDGMLAESAECKVLTEEYDNVIDVSEEAQAINRDYAKERDVLAKSLGLETDHFYKWFWASSLIEVERSYFPDKQIPEIVESYDRIQEAGDKALGPYQSTLNSKRLRYGLLISEMINYMQAKRDGSESSKQQKFIHYVGHDLTLVVMLGFLDAWEEFGRRPDYASNIALELHEDNDGEWFVRILYMERVPSRAVEVHVKRCEENHPRKRCTLDRFADLMRPYMIDSWQDWMNECKNDLTKLDPYAPGS